MSDDLKKKMLGAVAWSSIDRFGQQAVQFVIGLILARLLSIADFGLIGLVMVFSTLSFVLVESGFGQALIRKQDANETDYNTVFYFNIFTSLLLYLVLYFSAPAIAGFFNQPQLIKLCRIVFLAILFNAFYLVPFIKLGKVIDFKTIAKVNLISTTLSGIIGVTLAFAGFGVWALVAQQVLYHFIRMITFYSFVKWKPQLLFSFQIIRNFWGFSIHLLGTSVLNVIFNSLYTLILSRFYPIKLVGCYTQANKLSETFNSSFQSVLVGSTYALFVQIQHDNERFLRVFREIAKKTSMVTFPIMLVLIAVAHPFIFVLLSEKWMPAVPYFQLLCLSSLFAPLYVLNMSALNSRGKSKITFRIELIKKALILLSVVICFNFGFIVMLWGYILACFIAYLMSILYIKSDLNHYVKHQLFDFLGCIGIGTFIAICAFGLSFLINNNHVLLGSQIILSAILYIFSIKLFFNDLYIQIFKFMSEKLALLKKRI